MKYRLAPSLTVDHSPLKEYLEEGEEIDKSELLTRCAGRVSKELLQYVKELEFQYIGLEKNELYLR